MAKKQINVRLDQDKYDKIEARATAVGMEVPDYVRQLVEDESNDLRHRFLGAGAHFSQEWADTFTEEFGGPARDSGTRGAAA